MIFPVFGCSKIKILLIFQVQIHGNGNKIIQMVINANKHYPLCPNNYEKFLACYYILPSAYHWIDNETMVVYSYQSLDQSIRKVVIYLLLH